jgi:hypothetical protein
MSDTMSQEEKSELLSIFPYLESFPFEEYQIYLEAPLDESEGISPIIIKSLGKLGVDPRVDFVYPEEELNITVSFYLDSIKEIETNHNKIKKFDSLVKELDEALASKSIKDKLEIIKKGKSFIKKLGTQLLISPVFDNLLNDMCETVGINLSAQEKLALTRLEMKESLNRQFTSSEKKAILLYLNFYLNYAKILLGVTISIKIH